MDTALTCFILLFCQLALTAGNVDILCDNKENKTESERCCSVKKGLSLPKHLDEKDGRRIINKMTQRQMNTVWIDRQRKNIGWTWTNGTKLGNELGATDNNCGAINSSSKTLEAIHWSTRNMGFICEVEGCRGCLTLGLFQTNCRLLSGVCYVAFCGTENWYSARTTCVYYGMTFATLPRNETLFSLLRMNIFKVCPETWIGLRTTEWGYSLSYDVTAHWGPNEPSGIGDCVVGYREWGHQLRWRVSPCHDRHNFTCVDYYNDPFAESTTEDSHIEPTPGEKSNNGRRSTRLEIILPVTAITLFACIVCIGIFVYRRKRKKSYPDKKCRSSDGLGHSKQLNNGHQVEEEIEFIKSNSGPEDNLENEMAGRPRSVPESEEIRPPAENERQETSCLKAVQQRNLLSSKLTAWVYVNYQVLDNEQTLRVKVFAIDVKHLTYKSTIKFPEHALELLHVDSMELHLEDSNSSIFSEIQVCGNHEVSTRWRVEDQMKTVPVKNILESCCELPWTTLVDCEIVEGERRKQDEDLKQGYKKEDHVKFNTRVIEKFVDGSNAEPQSCRTTVIFDQLTEMVNQDTKLAASRNDVGRAKMEEALGGRH